MNITRSILDGLKTGLVLAATTTTVIMLASRKQHGNPWAAVNSIAHIIDGDDKEQPTDYSPRESRLGLLINATAMSAWGLLYESALQATGTRSNPLTAVLGTIASYLIDYKVVPKQYTPGIERRLTPRAVFLTYTVLGATLALSPLWNKHRGH